MEIPPEGVDLMREILEDLFFGEVKCSQSFTKLVHYREVEKKVNDAADKLEGQLKGEQAAILGDLLSGQSELNAITALECYIEGLRTGFKLSMALSQNE